MGAAFLRDRCVFGVACVLAANWCINTYIVNVMGGSPWGWFILTDFTSGVLAMFGVSVLCERFSIGSIFIGVSYAVECIGHTAYGLSDHGVWAEYHYYWSLYYIALGQMLFVASWGLYGLARGHFRAGSSVFSDMVSHLRRSPNKIEP